MKVEVYDKSTGKLTQGMLVKHLHSSSILLICRKIKESITFDGVVIHNSIDNQVGEYFHDLLDMDYSPFHGNLTLSN